MKILIKKDVLKQALDVIETQQNGLRFYRDEVPACVDSSDDEMDAEAEATIEALRAAIAQPESEPVGTVDEGDDGLFVDLETPNGVIVKRGEKLYTAHRQAALVPLTPEQRQAMWVAATIERPSQENCYLRGVIDGERAAGAQPVPTLSKEAIRACGGIVHSDGNVFFTSIDQLNATLESAKEMK